VAINEALAEYLALYHKGEANAVTSRELECNFQMRGSELRREINALRGDGIPICSFEGGYYYAATAEELERTIRQLRSRIKIAFAERGLSSALPDYVDTGQLSLPLDGGDAP
jgi:transcription initiation factor IIE alpha subunit